MTQSGACDYILVASILKRGCTPLFSVAILGGRALRVSDVESAPWLDPASSQAAAAALTEHGLLVCSSAVESALLKPCREVVIAALDTALLQPSPKLFGDVHSPLFRHDFKLELLPAISMVLQDALQSPIGMALVSAIGLNSQLCELSCIIVDGGAAEQMVHYDTPAHTQASAHSVASTRADTSAAESAKSSAAAACEAALRRYNATAEAEQPLLYTIFIPLQDTDDAMGPTHIWPGTHTPQFHAELQEMGSLEAQPGSSSMRKRLLCERPSVRMNLLAGACTCMDSRTWHRGEANTSGKRRCMLVASFAAADCQPPEGSTYSLLSALEGRHTLGSLLK